nr:hypothetical protein [uncultured Pseudodesulfovibrio sp.]
MQRIIIIIVLLLVGGVMASPCMAQEEVAGSNRYLLNEMSTGYYEEYEVIPGRDSPFLQWDEPRDTIRTGGRGRSATYQSDSHAGVPNYWRHRCSSCHKKEAHNNRHVTRNNIACRHCHGVEPIAGINHYNSPMNPIRRHAYVCAKCHQGASGSFAMYLVHEPAPLLAGTAESFPVLYWITWIMVAIAFFSFALFLPHTGLWMLRELFTRKKGGDE